MTAGPEEIQNDEGTPESVATEENDTFCSRKETKGSNLNPGFDPTHQSASTHSLVFACLQLLTEVIDSTLRCNAQGDMSCSVVSLQASCMTASVQVLHISTDCHIWFNRILHYFQLDKEECAAFHFLCPPTPGCD